jgi:hypothetical protein
MLDLVEEVARHWLSVGFVRDLELARGDDSDIHDFKLSQQVSCEITGDRVCERGWGKTAWIALADCLGKVGL